MNNILKDMGIDDFKDYVYTYEAVALDWWSKEYKTLIEIEVYEDNDEDQTNRVCVVFSTDAEKTAPRNSIFYTAYQKDQLEEKTLIEKSVFENVITDLDLQFLKSEDSYFTTSIEETKDILQQLVNLIQNKKPLSKTLLEDEEYEDDEEFEIEFNPEPGDALEHFIAMIDMNSVELIEENIHQLIEILMKAESADYLQNLLKDINSSLEFDFSKEYQIEQGELEFIKKAITSFKN